MDSKTAECALRTSRKSWVSELAVALGGLAWAASAGAASLCAPHEPVVFSCQVGEKLVSLCRPAHGEGMFSYRVGYRVGNRFGKRVGRLDALELRYPEPGRSARAAFTVTTTPLIGGGETTVAFQRNGRTYTVYSRVARADDGVTPRFEDGVLIARRGKVFKDMRCDDGGAGFREPLAVSTPK